MRVAQVGGFCIGDSRHRPVVIAGPCAAESLDLCREVARIASAVCASLRMPYVFKASFDKANRTSGTSYRGPGMKVGLEWLAAVKAEFGVPVLTDIHETHQAAPVAEVADIVQIPAFLCRQTDLLVAAARTGRCVNVKKGQFMAPADMAHAVAKIEGEGNRSILLTERGVSFGYHTLVVDMCSLPQMRALGYPVCFDGTHSVQQPSAAGGRSGGMREYVPHLVRAATAVGLDALFLEVHPDPPKGLSDPATMWPLAELEGLLREVAALDDVVKSRVVDGSDRRERGQFSGGSEGE
jgi:2-dehydro-3-deoxyphosphooctonate aldolase (KDO 8-P synthase)